MTWRLDISRSAEKFLEKNRFSIEEVREHIVKAIQYFRGEDVNADIKKLKGKWAGFYRIRSGRIRIIAEFDFDNSAVLLRRSTGAEMFIKVEGV